MFLLDTNVISEMRKIRTGNADPALAAWARGSDADSFYLSAVTILELEVGLLLKARRDPSQSDVLHHWLHRVILPAFVDRILPVDVPVALRCPSLHVPKTRPQGDALIAATAVVHKLTLVTRNAKDFEDTGVRLLNPWQSPAAN